MPPVPISGVLRHWHGEPLDRVVLDYDGRPFDDLRAAQALVRSVLPPTPAHAWPLVARRLGATAIVKHENHLPTGAFKVRGGLVYVEALKRRAGGEATGPAPYKPGFSVVGEANAAPARDFSPAALKSHQAFMARPKNPTPAAARAAPAASAAAPAPGVGQVIHQKNTFTTTVHTSSDQPKAVGEATGQGIATAQQKATNNALIAVRRP